MGELIEKLKAFPAETRVVYEDYEGMSHPGFEVECLELFAPEHVPPLKDGETQAEYRAWRRAKDRILNEGRDKPWVLIR